MPARRRADAPSAALFAVRLTAGELDVLGAAAAALEVAPRDLFRSWLAGGCPLAPSSSGETTAAVEVLLVEPTPPAEALVPPPAPAVAPPEASPTPATPEAPPMPPAPRRPRVDAFRARRAGL